MPGKLKLQIIQGATFKRKFTYRTNTGPVDLTGASLSLIIAPADLSSQVIYSSSSGHIQLDGDPTLGKFIIRIPPATTAAYSWQSARYNLNIEFPTGDVTRLLEGGMSVSRRV